jgi:hypothetical protein
MFDRSVCSTTFRMADPFGIVGVISLTIQITNFVVQCGLDWRDAPYNVKSFLAELQSLKVVLSETNTDLLLNSDFADCFQTPPSLLLSQLGPNAPANTDTKITLSVCEKELGSLLEGLKKRAEGHQVAWEQLKEAFLPKDTRESLENLQRQCRMLNSMVAIDTAALGAATYKQVKGSRKEQEEAQKGQTGPTEKITPQVREIEIESRPYTSLVCSMQENHPNLANLAAMLKVPSENGTATVIKFYDTCVAENRFSEERFSHSTELLDYLNRQEECSRRLFLLQGLPSNFIEILGSWFNIDPNFYARQIKSGLIELCKEVGEVPLLSSHPTFQESFNIRYLELRQFIDPIWDYQLRVMDQRRRISVSKWNGEFDGVGMVRKSTSAWFRVNKGNGWDGKYGL